MRHMLVVRGRDRPAVSVAEVGARGGDACVEGCAGERGENGEAEEGREESGMTNETKTPHVYEAWGKVIADMASEGIAKGRTNTQGAGFKFRGIDDVLNALATSYARHGLGVGVRYTDRHETERATKSGGALFVVSLFGVYTLYSTVDGSSVEVGAFFGEAMDSSDKATNKAMSAAYKYFAIQTFSIPTEGDNDADAHTPEPAARSGAKSPAPVAKTAPKILSGAGKGKPLSEAEDVELTAYHAYASGVLNDKSKADLHAKAQAALDATEAEMSSRVARQTRGAA